MITVPQLVMFTGTGLMKSFSCEVKRVRRPALQEGAAERLALALVEDEVEVELRLAERPGADRAVRPSPSDSAAGIGVVLIVPAAWAAAVRSSAGPHADPGPLADLDRGDRAALLDAVLDQQVAGRANRVDAVARRASMTG